MPTVKEPSDLLRDMKHVWNNREDTDVTEGQLACRQLLNRDKKAFIQHMAALERAFNPKLAERNEKEKAPKDEGLDKCLELIDKLLEEWQHVRDNVPKDKGKASRGGSKRGAR